MPKSLTDITLQARITNVDDAKVLLDWSISRCLVSEDSRLPPNAHRLVFNLVNR